jgi:hypothetical protein
MNYRRNKPVKTYPAESAFAASAAAFRVNGGQYVSLLDGTTDPTKTANRVLMLRFLEGESAITDADRQLGTEIRDYLKTYLFKVVSGQLLNDFDSKALSLASGEVVNHGDIGILAYYPVTLERAREQSKLDERLYNCRSEYAGEIGAKISTTVEIVKSVYSANWNTHFVTAITADNLLVRFSCKQPVVAGSVVAITAKVKDRVDNWTTKLNYVKVITK